MAYVVIVCSRCRLARGAPETAKTASCPGCGRKLRVPELRKYFRSESLSQVAEAIGQLNARLKGGLDVYLEDLGESRSVPARKSAPRPDPEQESARREDDIVRQTGRAVPSNKLDRAIILCMMGRGSIAPEELLPLLPMKCTAEQLDRRLEALRRSGLLFEPRPGRYALVS
jgi:hypothetical protein